MHLLAELLDQYAAAIGSHRQWLELFDGRYASKWERLLKADAEAAICEAVTRELLQMHGVTIIPNDDPSHGGPDYLCARDAKQFYVEVTCITKGKAARKTGLPDLHQGCGRIARFNLLTPTLLGELCNKVPQVSNLDNPCIVLVGTLHLQASAVCFYKPFVEQLLTGTPKVVCRIDPGQGRAIGEPYQVTYLSDSVFTRFEKGHDGPFEFTRKSISAILLSGFEGGSAHVVGLLHPNPKYPFDRRLLPGIEFAKLADASLETRALRVEWV